MFSPSTFFLSFVTDSQKAKGPAAFCAARNARHAQTAAAVGLADRLILPSAGVEMPPLDAIVSVGCELGDVAAALVGADESKALALVRGQRQAQEFTVGGGQVLRVLGPNCGSRVRCPE